VIADRGFRREFGIHRNRAVPSAHAIKTWVWNFEATGFTVKKKGGSVKTVRTAENIAVVREAIERSPHRSARHHSVSLGMSVASVQRILHTPHRSGVETSNSARSQTNSCGDASKSNGWRSQETYRMPRAEL
jgi:N-acyl-D-aspartate/D-glutamate deacylase